VIRTQGFPCAAYYGKVQKPVVKTLPILTCLLLAGAHLPARAASLEGLLAVQTQVQSVLEKTNKAIVAIECDGGTASGVIINEDGLVLTAGHVTGKPGKKVIVVLHDGKTVEGESLGLDSTTDAAMVQLPTLKKPWPTAPMQKDGRVTKPGDWCFALGHPGGYDITRGAVLRVGRVVKVASNILQSDCVLMGGDSGGGLFNTDGELIGINREIWPGRDQNLHVSMAPFFRSWDAMKKGEVIRVWSQGSGGWIGLSTQPVTDGLSIQAIAPESPAMKAGLQVGELILSVSGKKLASPSEFSETIRSKLADDLVTLIVKTATGQRSVDVKLAKKPGT